jgi:hypothetical protein
MNERIKELIEQAVKDVDIVTGNELLDDELAKMYIPDCFAEKFAELIVRDCMGQVEEQYKPMSRDETMMKDKHWVGYVDCGVDSCLAIKEHFGVEE